MLSRPLPLPHRRHWSPPPSGVIKINTDGVYIADLHSSGIGVVARDRKGDVLGGLAQHLLHCSDGLQAEMNVVLAVMELASSKGWEHVILETDSAIVANKFNRDGPDLSALGP